MKATDRFAGPDCGVDGCQREVGHIGDHRRVERVTPLSIDRKAFGLVDDDGDGYGGREAIHPGDCPATLSYGHDRRTRGCVEYEPPPVKAPFDDLEDESADLRMTLAAASAEIVRLRGAIENFIVWWDNPPYVLDDDDGLAGEVDALREAIK